MPETTPKPQRTQLALWVAAGGTVGAWCDKHKVKRRTGYEWSKKPPFRRLVEELRHRVVDRAIGKMTKNLIKAVDTIVRLMKEGQSDSVKLGAARILIEKLMDVQSHAELKVELR